MFSSSALYASRGRGTVTAIDSTIRAGSGRVALRRYLRERAIVAADNLNPQKARVLLALALARSADPAEIQRMFATY